MNEKAPIAVISMGGTAAMTSTGSRGARPTLDAAGLIAALPRASATGSIVADTLKSAPGASLTLHDLRALHDRAVEHLTRGARGVVVVQGTDSLEETAFVLDLLWADEAPLVFTGAMRHANAPGADGAANLSDAIEVAASSQSRGWGVLVTLAGTIHAARYAQKVHTSSVDAFRARTAGPAGFVSEGDPRYFWGRPTRPKPLRLRHEPPPRVALVTAALGIDEQSIERAAREADGVVVEAFGGGHVPADWVPALRRAADRIPVVLASRTAAGPVLEATYDFDGAEIGLIADGMIPAGHLDGLKSRVLLQLALATGLSREEIAQRFRFYR